MGCHFLLQGIFPTQGSNLGLLHCRQTLYHLSYQGSKCYALGVYKSIKKKKSSVISCKFSDLDTFWRANPFRYLFSSVQFNSVTQSCPTLCDPTNHSTPGLPVYHQLPESTQTHVHRVCDAIQPSHPLSSPSPPAPNPSQHQSLFQ